jgi:Dolichol phosphate-mannose biosynthesis regulatory protein (DPM2)
MELGDKAVGALLTTISLTIFSYYTFWIIILVSFFLTQIFHIPLTFSFLCVALSECYMVMK